MFSRRKYLTLTIGSLAGTCARGQSGKPDPLAAFLEKYRPPGFSYIVSKDGKITHQSATGFANLERKEKLTTTHRFRIASVSKPITATAIFWLIEQGKVKLSDPVFGPDGIVPGQKDEGITIHHLLNHTSGGWPNRNKDPMFQENQLGHADLIKWTLENRPPDHPPGKNYAYSNFGYCLLGRVIEKASGKSYENIVREHILKPCGSEGMFVEKGSREVSYYTDDKPDTYEMNVPRMDAHGGWIGTPKEMLDFALSVDGFPQQPDILKQSSLDLMTTASTINEHYACGWNVNKHGNYWHSGSLPGLTSLLARTRSGYCWAACANTRRKGMGAAMDRLMWDLAKS
ncbi:MAG: serine hydrolase domain-containing protein [Akkermansiaceae bacterium]